MGQDLKSKIPLLIGAMAVAAVAGIASAAEPAISSITATPTDTTAIINWTTDVPATSQVLYGTSMDLTASTTLDSGLVTNHMVALTDLIASTTYHFAVRSSDSTGSTTISSHQMFTTAPFESTPSAGATSTPGTATSTASTATTTAFLNLSIFSGAPGASVIAVGTNFGASEPITIDFSGAVTGIATDASGNFSTTLFVPAVASGSIPISATGGTSGRAATNTFFVQQTTATTTATSTATSNDMTSLLSEVMQLRAEVATLKQQMAMLMANMEQHMQMMMQGGSGMGTSSSGAMSSSSSLCTATPSGTGHIDQNGASVRAGANIDFGGHDFGCEESVIVMRGGVQAGSAFTNRAGSFSTGSMMVPSTPGSYMYTFTGRNSGTTASATITVTP